MAEDCSPPCPSQSSESASQESPRQHLPVVCPLQADGGRATQSICAGHMGVLKGQQWRSLGCEGPAPLGSWLRTTEPFGLQTLPIGSRGAEFLGSQG